MRVLGLRRHSLKVFDARRHSVRVLGLRMQGAFCEGFGSEEAF